MAIPKADQEFVEGIHRYEAGKIIQRERIDVLETENRALQEKVVLLEEKLAACKRLAQQAEEVSDWEYVFNCLHQIEVHASLLKD